MEESSSWDLFKGSSFKEEDYCYYRAKHEIKCKNYRKGLTTAEKSELQEKMKNFHIFCQSVHHLESKPLNNQVLEHCERTNINMQRLIKSQNILKITQNRVQKMIKNKRVKKNWNTEDMIILLWVISKYAEKNSISSIEDEFNDSDWQKISSVIPGVSGKACMFKWLSLKKNKVNEHQWSEEESLLLGNIVQKNSKQSWSTISQILYSQNRLSNKIYRCSKQCREHWSCYLKPNLKKGPWSREQDILLLTSVKNLKGSKKWAQIYEKFDGRTENALKNRFTLLMKKQKDRLKKEGKAETDMEIILGLLNSIANEEEIENIEHQMINETKQKSKQIPLKTVYRKQVNQLENLFQIQNQPQDVSFIQLEKDKSFKEQKSSSYRHIDLFHSASSFSRENLFPLDPIEDSLLHFNETPEPQEKQEIKDSLMIDASNVNVIECRKEELEKLKTEVHSKKFSFLPCVLDKNNMIKPCSQNKS